MSAADLERRALDIFEDVCDAPESHREALLESRCGDDERLRRRVRRLLARDAGSAEAVESARGAGIEALAASLAEHGASVPERIGRYAVVREIGRGGMGIVYEAEQSSPRRRVALKVLRRTFAGEVAVRRFRQEAELLARLQHRGIAHVYESGATEGPDAWPYLAMELIDGRPIDRHAEHHDLDTRQRLELIARVCDAVQHAHQKGIIHRDLKPANVLVVEERTATDLGDGESGAAVDAIGQPKVLDFGIARVTDADVTVATMQTSTGQILGTLASMSPEQIEGIGADIDTRADVYALGVMLHLLVAGRLPYDLSGLSITDAMRTIRDTEPPRLGALDPSLRGDIETIVATALEKDRERRYRSAGALAEDIRRHLRDAPILARPASAMYQVRKFARRHRALVGATALAFALLALGATGTTIGLVQALRSNEALTATNTELTETMEDLALVADFQSERLAAIDVRGMGGQIRQSLLDAAPEDRRADLDEHLRAINLTDVAQGAIEASIIDQTIAEIDAQFAEEPLLRVKLLHSVADSMQNFEMYDRAAAQVERAIAICDDHSELDANIELACVQLLALIRRHQGRYADSERLYRRCAEGFEALEGPRSERAMFARFNLGMFAAEAGRFPEAERILADVLAGQRAVLGADDMATSQTLAGYAHAIRMQGRTADAEPLLREILAQRRGMLGASHPGTLAATNDLGITLIGLDRLEEAAALLEDGVSRARTVMGDHDPTTAALLSALATTWSRQGRAEEAEAAGREAADIMRAVAGDDHPRTLIMRSYHAAYLGALGRHEEVIEVCDEILPPLLAPSGALDARSTLVRERRGAAHLALGQFAAAETDLTTVAEATIAGAGPDDRAWVSSVKAVIDLYDRWHESDPTAGHDAQAAAWRARLDS